jgi:hypothetical protein
VTRTTSLSPTRNMERPVGVNASLRHILPVASTFEGDGTAPVAPAAAPASTTSKSEDRHAGRGAWAAVRAAAQELKETHGLVADASQALQRVMDDVLTMQVGPAPMRRCLATPPPPGCLGAQKMESNAFQMAFGAMRVKQLLGSVARQMSPWGGARGVKLSVKLDHGLPRYVLGDFYRLQQVVRNFCSNAIKFAPEGTGQVVLRARVVSRRVEPMVTAAGVGSLFIAQGSAQTNGGGGGGMSPTVIHVASLSAGSTALGGDGGVHARIAGAPILGGLPSAPDVTAAHQQVTERATTHHSMSSHWPLAPGSAAAARGAAAPVWQSHDGTGAGSKRPSTSASPLPAAGGGAGAGTVYLPPVISTGHRAGPAALDVATPTAFPPWVPAHPFSPAAAGVLQDTARTAADGPPPAPANLTLPFAGPRALPVHGGPAPPRPPQQRSPDAVTDGGVTGTTIVGQSLRALAVGSPQPAALSDEGRAVTVNTVSRRASLPPLDRSPHSTASRRSRPSPPPMVAVLATQRTPPGADAALVDALAVTTPGKDAEAAAVDVAALPADPPGVGTRPPAGAPPRYLPSIKSGDSRPPSGSDTTARSAAPASPVMGEVASAPPPLNTARARAPPPAVRALRSHAGKSDNGSSGEGVGRSSAGGRHSLSSGLERGGDVSGQVYTAHGLGTPSITQAAVTEGEVVAATGALPFSAAAGTTYEVRLPRGLAWGEEVMFLRLEVADNGRGIAPADQAKLFAPFMQVGGR